jgi:hypothetical protein
MAVQLIEHMVKIINFFATKLYDLKYPFVSQGVP